MLHVDIAISRSQARLVNANAMQNLSNVQIAHPLPYCTLHVLQYHHWLFYIKVNCVLGLLAPIIHLLSLALLTIESQLSGDVWVGQLSGSNLPVNGMFFVSADPAVTRIAFIETSA